MFKVTALSVLLAAMGIGNTFANPMDVDFNTMDLAVNMGTNEVYSVRFDVNLANFVTEYECEAVLKGNSMDIINECSQTSGSPGSKLYFEVENPLPVANQKWIFGGHRSPKIDGSLTIAFTHYSTGQTKPAKFNIAMPVDKLVATKKNENTYVFSSKKVLNVGKDGQFVRGGSDGSNQVLESESASTFRDPQLNRASVGGGSTIRPNSRIDLGEDSILSEESGDSIFAEESGDSIFSDDNNDSESVPFDGDIFSNDIEESSNVDDLSEFLRAKEEASI